MKGAFLIDHSQRPRSGAATVRKRVDMTARGCSAAVRAVRELGGEEVLRSVPLESDLNVAAAVLQRGLCKTWVEASARMAARGRRLSCRVLQEPRHRFFSRCNSVVQFEVKYS